jgi:hypothetical protein
MWRGDGLNERNWRVTRGLGWVLGLLLLGVCGAAGAQALPLIPLPASVVRHAGNFVVSDTTPVVLRSDAAAPEFAAQHFIDTLARTSALRLRLVTGDGVPARRAIVFQLDPVAPVARPGGYALEVTPQGVTVTARDAKGLFYGGVTLWQLLTPGVGNAARVSVSALLIEDCPRFAWRGLMLDSARHFQSVADIEKLIDWMSLQKLNVLHWHLTDDQGWRLEIPRCPQLDGVRKITLMIGNLPYNFALWTDAAKVVVRPNATPAGELLVHEDSCTGPLLATLPLAPAARTPLQTTLTAAIPATRGDHTLCIVATGDPRAHLWAVDKVELRNR